MERPITCKFLNVPFMLHFPWSRTLVKLLSLSKVSLMGQYSSCNSIGSCCDCIWIGCGCCCCGKAIRWYDCWWCRACMPDGVTGGDVLPLCGGDPDNKLLPLVCWDCCSSPENWPSSKSTDSWCCSIEPNFTSYVILKNKWIMNK